MARKRPSIDEIANVVGGIRRADEVHAEEKAEPEAPPTTPAMDESESAAEEEVEQQVYWRKYTVPFRQDQLDRLDSILVRWAADKRVKLSTAEVIRLALDELIQRMEDAPDAVLVALHEQEQREQREVPTRKYSRSRGVAKYLKRKELV